MLLLARAMIYSILTILVAGATGQELVLEPSETCEGGKMDPSCTAGDRGSSPAAGATGQELVIAPFETCEGGKMDPRCTAGDRGLIDWPEFLQLVCRMSAGRWKVTLAALKVLSRFDKEGALACPGGFLTALLALFAAQAQQWYDQTIRFRPDGNVSFLVSTWDYIVMEENGTSEFRQWVVTLPSTQALDPPWPPWRLCGPLLAMREAQDLSEMHELPRDLRCNSTGLSLVGCSGGGPWAELLRVMCERCTTSMTAGLPCVYTSDLRDAVSAAMETHRNQMARPACPHGLLAAVLAMGSHAARSQPEVMSQVFRVPKDDGGRAALVLHTVVRQVAENPHNLVMFNVPMLDLSPFPMHTGVLRSARWKTPKDAGYYREFLGALSAALARAGIQHVLLPGDLSVGYWTKDAGFLTHSLFIPQALQSEVKTALPDILSMLPHDFGGLWRVATVSNGLWQIGEEPYRFSPQGDLAYRVFCSQCIFASLYFYLLDGQGSLLPLANWLPCRIPIKRIFPSKPIELGSSSAPLAADAHWLHRMQRPPFVQKPAAQGSGITGNCQSAKEQLLQRRHQSAGVADEAPSPVRPASLTPEFDLSAGVYSEMGLFDLMRQREDSEQAGLRRYSDKLRFKSRLIEQGVPIPKVFYMSNESADVLPVLQQLETSRFVAKPTHLAATSFVYVIRDGINLVNGKSTSLDEVAAGIKESWQDRHVDDWATESVQPGVIVEELIEPPDRGAAGGSTPDELKCLTFFGELLFCEWVFVRNMTTGQQGAEFFSDAHLAGDRAQPSLGHKSCGIPNFVSKGYIFKDGSCFDCVEPVPVSKESWARLVQIVEKVAAGTDHIRIDMFVTPDGDVVVNEANISFLKTSKFPPILVEEMRRRWVEGYFALG